MAGQFDSWDSYFWEPGGTVLRNLYGERDGTALARREYRETGRRLDELVTGRVDVPRTYDSDHLRAIHRHLFGRVYEWAGGVPHGGGRERVEQLAEPASIDRYLTDAASSIRTIDWARLDRDQFAAAAARTFSYVNTGHPFREGNGRTAKLFMQHVAELSPWRIDYNPAVSGVTPETWSQASMLSSPDRGKYEPVPDSLVPVFRAMAQLRTAAI